MPLLNVLNAVLLVFFIIMADISDIFLITVMNLSMSNVFDVKNAFPLMLFFLMSLFHIDIFLLLFFWKLCWTKAEVVGVFLKSNRSYNSSLSALAPIFRKKLTLFISNPPFRILINNWPIIYFKKINNRPHKYVRMSIL